jgi:hypothetical protein
MIMPNSPRRLPPDGLKTRGHWIKTGRKPPVSGSVEAFARAFGKWFRYAIEEELRYVGTPSTSASGRDG